VVAKGGEGISEEDQFAGKSGEGRLVALQSYAWVRDQDISGQGTQQERSRLLLTREIEVVNPANDVATTGQAGQRW